MSTNPLDEALGKTSEALPPLASFAERFGAGYKRAVSEADKVAETARQGLEDTVAAKATKDAERKKAPGYGAWVALGFVVAAGAGGLWYVTKKGAR